MLIGYNNKILTLDINHENLDLLIWDWKENPEIAIDKDFIASAYNHAKKNFPNHLEFYLPRVGTLVENFVGSFTKKMNLSEHYIMIKAEVSELQKFLTNLGFKQPTIFEFCRMKVNLLIRLGMSYL